MPETPGNVPILLFVDDDDLVLMSLQVFFSAAGYETLAFRSIGEALRLCKRFEITPAAVVLNYHLHDGLSFDARLSLLADDIPDAPLAVLTGDTSRQTAAIVKDRGISLLYKPVSPVDLLTHVRGLIGFGSVQDLGSTH
ncbi:response regulator [Azospirillum rugosum]|uniref:DNA-binding response OmpR family regulator n=1 Tax=Azospirillum rugosum TaxID=416170 RepID=A0ABS4SWJ3_9PROT|nr:response regulator [Azospirillum rugosum]MBP2296928.1 DNA-binding response OmpR family regulator [Azospirillum rugosum]MDQ0530687.1 DNA-binding response OmpR family regulator [Azospirillum rugosum]